MIILLYSLIILFSTTVGAIAGLGGGVIIKPMFDLIGYHDATTIGFYSSVAVFTMCIVSIYKQSKKEFQFDTRMLISISVGSIIGGLLGESIFQQFRALFPDGTIKAIQAALLAITLVIILIFTLKSDKIKNYQIQNIFITFLLGLFLGSISVFLGIGGGPLNVAILMFMFSLPMKKATVYSIATIFFSQISKLTNIVINGQLQHFDLSFLPFIMVSAVLGGYIGTLINQKLDDKKIQKIYILLICFLIGISIFNIFQNI